MAPDENRPQHPSEPVMELLQEHVPLSLLMDMAAPGGPRSRELLETEGLPEQEWWHQP